MPELPEVQTIVNSLAARVVGRRIAGASLRRADFITPEGFDLPSAIVGRSILKINRRAKRIVIELDDGNSFFIHLGMSGRLTMHVNGEAERKHTHLTIDLGGGPQIRLCDPRRFGGVFWLGNTIFDDPSLGPEPLAMSWQVLHERLKKTRRAIKTALLDQKLIAGLGNIYADEALFEAQIDPRKRANRLNGEQARRLHKSIQRVLLRAIRHKGSTLRDYVNADGANGGFQKLHRVYGREGESCLRCGKDFKIRRIVLGGRSTHFCPNCQRSSRNRQRKR